MGEVFGGDTTPKFMVIDNDSIFLPVAKLTLPGMGIEVVRTGFKSPWQNGVVERFNRTLDDDLLDHDGRKALEQVADPIPRLLQSRQAASIQ